MAEDTQGKTDASFGVIFDVDGTMVDNACYHQAAWQEVGRRHGIDVTAEFYREYIHARSNDHIVRTLLGRSASAEETDRISSEKEIFYRDSCRALISEVSGLTALLKKLKRLRIPCAAASNSPQGNVDMVLDEFGIRGYFEVVICRDDVAMGKPDPELFLTTAKRLGVLPKKCVIFEDSVSGFQAAQNAGMPYIVISAASRAEQFEYAKGAAAIYEDFTMVEIPRLQAVVT